MLSTSGWKRTISVTIVSPLSTTSQTLTSTSPSDEKESPDVQKILVRMPSRYNYFLVKYFMLQTYLSDTYDPT